METRLAQEFRLQAARHLLEDFMPRIEKAVALLDQDDLWWRPNAQSNSVGNLLMHLSGNVRQWIMSGLDRQPDMRTRDVEFATREGFTSEQLLTQLRATVAEAADVIEGLSARQLLDTYRIQIYDVSGVQALFHVVEHFSYHVGQILFIAKLLKNQDLGFYADLDAKKSRF